MYKFHKTGNPVHNMLPYAFTARRNSLSKGIFMQLQQYKTDKNDMLYKSVVLHFCYKNRKRYLYTLLQRIKNVLFY